MPGLLAPRDSTATANVSFQNLPAGFTTGYFILPKCFVEMQLVAADPNNPGVCTLQDINSNTICSINTTVGDIKGVTGSVYAEIPAGQYKINVTQNVSSVHLYFDDTMIG